MVKLCLFIIIIIFSYRKTTPSRTYLLQIFRSLSDGVETFTTVRNNIYIYISIHSYFLGSVKRVIFHFHRLLCINLYPTVLRGINVVLFLSLISEVSTSGQADEKSRFSTCQNSRQTKYNCSRR